MMFLNDMYRYMWGCAVISATSHVGDSEIGDKPPRRQQTRRHESVNSATTYFLPFIIYF